MRIASQDELRGVQLQLLDCFMDYCKRNRLRCFLTGGTAIGAIRHHGYIPWDDDIDLSMPREDYRAAAVGFAKAHPQFDIYFPGTEGYPHPFIKIADPTTRLYEYNDHALDNLGINIDIFPLDGAPDAFLLRWLLFLRIYFWRNILNLKTVVDHAQRHPLKRMVLRFGKRLALVFDLEFVVKRMDRLASRVHGKKAKYSGILVWARPNQGVVSTSVFSSETIFEFEGRRYPVPIGYDTWLKATYGDYMTPPSLDKQQTHHGFLAYVKEGEE